MSGLFRKAKPYLVIAAVVVAVGIIWNKLSAKSDKLPTLF